MSHLSLETLARLVDEAPTPAESAHLGLCGECRSELEGMRADAAALAALPAIAPPAGAWRQLQTTLADEGLIAQRVARRTRSAGLLRLAAGIALFAMGTGTGVYLASSTAAPSPDGTSTALAPIDSGAHAGDEVNTGDVPGNGASRLATNEPGEPSPIESTAPADADRSTPQQRQIEPAEPRAPTVVPEPRRPVRLASTGPQADAPLTAEEALGFMRQAETTYLEALTRYAELAGGFDGGDPAARLAALEGIVLTTRAALGQAPADPIINGYHMTALAQREATLRQIAAASSQTWF